MKWSRFAGAIFASAPRRNHALVFLQLAANAVIGYGFSRILAYKFGVSAEKDGFDIAYSVPFIILNLSGFVFAHAVVSTHFSKLRVADPERIQVVFSTVLIATLALGGLLIALCVACDDQLINLLAPGLPAGTREQARLWMLLMLPLTMTLGISAFLSAVLAAFAVPLTAECSQIVSRLAIFVWFFIAGAGIGLEGISIVLVCGSILGLAITGFILHRRTGLRLTLDFAPWDPRVREIMWQGGSFVVAALAAQASMAYMRRLATIDAIGTNAMLTYCFGLVAPLSILMGKPLSIVMGPAYVALSAAGRVEEARRLLMKNIAFSTAAGVAVAAAISAFAAPVVRLFYAGGNFGDEAVAMTAELCALIAWSLPAAILLWVVLVPTIHGRNRLLPAAIYSTGYLVQIAATAWLFPEYKKGGLVAAYLIGVYLQAALSVIVAMRECHRVSLPSVLPKRVCHEPTC